MNKYVAEAVKIAVLVSLLPAAIVGLAFELALAGFEVGRFLGQTIRRWVGQ